MTEEKRKRLIAALLREREGCERRKLTKRVRAINAELARLGYIDEKAGQKREIRPRGRGKAEKR